MNIREALSLFRARATKAQRRGGIYNETVLLDNGRTVIVYHAEAPDGGYLFGAWRYQYQEEGARSRALTF